MADKPIIFISIIDIYTWKPLSRTTKVNKLLKALDKETIDRLFHEFAVFVLLFYRSLVQQSIKNQKFRKKFIPLSEKYRKYKESKRLLSGFWQATGFLQQHLELWRASDGAYNVGFSEEVMHPRTKAPLSIILKVLEEGSEDRNIPARPLFWPLARAMSKHVYDTYFMRFMRNQYPEYLKFLK